MSRAQNFGFIDLFALLLSSMIGVGIFVLPGLVFAQTGILEILAYLVAGIFTCAGITAMIELTSAMPKPGGDLFYIARTLGSLIGSVSGILSWGALALVSAVSIRGAVYMAGTVLSFDPQLAAPVAAAVVTLSTLLPWRYGRKFSIVIASIIVAVLVIFAAASALSFSPAKFAVPENLDVPALLSSAAMVFVSFIPAFNLWNSGHEFRQTVAHKSFITAILVAAVLGGLTMAGTISLFPAGTLAVSLSPVSQSAESSWGPAAGIALVVVGMAACLNASLFTLRSASRYPFTMALEGLFPAFAQKTNKVGFPFLAALPTGLIVVGFQFLDFQTAVRAGSTLVLCVLMLANVALILMRLSRVRNYRPSFNAPLFPVLQILSIFVYAVLLVLIGPVALLIGAGFVTLGVVMYLLYGRKAAKSDFALTNLVKGIANRAIATDHLEQELLDVLHSIRKVELDRFDHLIKDSRILDLAGPVNLDDLLDLASTELSGMFNDIDNPPDQNGMLGLLHERERQSSTAISQFVAIPHIIVPGEGLFRLLMIRVQEGARFSDEHDRVRAVFVLSGSSDERNFHLRCLAAIAQTVQERDFERDWLDAERPVHLRDLMLRSNRKRFPGGI